jgi:tetrahydromethanopterin S-methyltransferase subunit F
MPAFGKLLSAAFVEAIRAYLIKRRTDLAVGNQTSVRRGPAIGFLNAILCL